MRNRLGFVMVCMHACIKVTTGATQGVLVSCADLLSAMDQVAGCSCLRPEGVCAVLSSHYVGLLMLQKAQFRTVILNNVCLAQRPKVGGRPGAG